jgi:hypothetical protein
VRRLIITSVVSFALGAAAVGIPLANELRYACYERDIQRTARQAASSEWEQATKSWEFSLKESNKRAAMWLAKYNECRGKTKTTGGAK